MSAITTSSSRLHVPLAVQDALRRGRPAEAAQRLREANPGLDLRQARTALAEVALTVPLVSRSMPPSPAVKAANLVLPRLSPMPVAPPSEVALTSPLA